MLSSPKDNFWRIGPIVVGALIVIGVVTELGVTRAVGCVSELPWVVDFRSVPTWSHASLNVALSAVLFVFACTAAVSTRPIALGLMAVESVSFVLFLFLLRGGYAVGYSGAPILQVVQYDVLSVAGRVGVLGLLAFGKHPSSRLLIKVALLGVGAALLVVGIKAALFRIPAW
jgi:hypothetical protein